MPYFYKYLHSDWVVESVEPRPDLLAFAYWSETDAPASKPDKGGVLPEPVAVVNDSPDPQPIIESAPAPEAVAVPEPVTEPTPAADPVPASEPAPADDVKPAPVKKAPAKKAPAKPATKKAAE